MAGPQIPLIGAKVDITLTGALVENVDAGGAYVQVAVGDRHYTFGPVDSAPGVSWSFTDGGLVASGTRVQDARGTVWQVTPRGMWTDDGGRFLPYHALMQPLTSLIPAQSPAVAS